MKKENQPFFSLMFRQGCHHQAQGTTPGRHQEKVPRPPKFHRQPTLHVGCEDFDERRGPRLSRFKREQR